MQKRYGFIIERQGFLSFFVLFTSEKHLFQFSGLSPPQKKTGSSPTNHQILRFLKRSKKNKRKAFWAGNPQLSWGFEVGASFVTNSGQTNVQIWKSFC